MRGYSWSWSDTLTLLLVLFAAALTIALILDARDTPLECDFGYIEVTVADHETQCVAWETVADFPFTD